MIKDKCISVTDLRKNTKECFKDLILREKYIFLNNKPIAVLLDINKYEDLISPYELEEAETSLLSDELISKANTARGLKTDQLVNI